MRGRGENDRSRLFSNNQLNCELKPGLAGQPEPKAAAALAS